MLFTNLHFSSMIQNSCMVETEYSTKHKKVSAGKVFCSSQDWTCTNTGCMMRYCMVIQGRLVWRGCRAAAFPVRQKIPPNGQTRLKSGFSCEISQHNHFRYFRHYFGSTFPRNPTKPMFRSFRRTPLMRWRFQHTCRWIWRFRGCLRHSPKGNKPNNWLQETWWYIRLSQSVFVILTMNF